MKGNKRTMSSTVNFVCYDYILYRMLRNKYNWNLSSILFLIGGPYSILVGLYFQVSSPYGIFDGSAQCRLQLWAKPPWNDRSMSYVTIREVD